ncbi:MAG: hypothetical protein ACLTDX_21650 [[Clostridium] innocuum]
MKKVLSIVCLLLLFYGRYELVDLASLERRTKQIEVKGEVSIPVCIRWIFMRIPGRF